MNQGDPTETRIYFAPHFVAKRKALFEREGVAVDFIWSEAGDYLAKSGQIPAVLKGDADLTIGGPMVTMRMKAEGAADLVCFSAAVRANPWFLASRPDAPPFTWDGLAGRSVLDVSRITTATLCFGWILRQRGLAHTTRLIDGSGDEAADLARVAAGEVDYALHSLHGLAPLAQRGALKLATSLAGAMGPVPWSAYIARRDQFEAERDSYAAFTRAIQAAFAWIAASTPEAIADLVADDYPDYPRAALEYGIATYKAQSVWPTTTTIAEADYQRFHDILRECGWIPFPVAYHDQVVRDLAC
jgi:NitT/TauT family transport system substrate-binding protein